MNRRRLRVAWDVVRRRIGRETPTRQELEMQLRQAQKMAAIGQLVEGIAYEFSDNLAAIISFADIAIDEIDVASRARQDVEEIRRAAKGAAALTRQLLTFSTQDAGPPAVLGLNALVGDFCKMLRRFAGANVELSTRLEPDVGYVSVVGRQIEQVILNLVLHAREALPGGGRLTVQTRLASPEERSARAREMRTVDGVVKLVVTTTGTAMKPITGTGLGLATAHRIVQEAGGCLVVEPTPDSGSAVIVYLPSARPLGWAVLPRMP